MNISLFQSGCNEDPDEVLLDSEMEKVFAAPNSLKEKFDVTTFQDTVHPIGSYKSKNGKAFYENIKQKEISHQHLQSHFFHYL